MQDMCYPLKLKLAFFCAYLSHLKVGHCKFVHHIQMNKQWTSFYAVKSWYRELETTNLQQTKISPCFTDKAMKYLIMEF